MPQSKRRKPRPAGGFVPKSQRDFGTLDQHEARRAAPKRDTGWGHYDKPIEHQPQRPPSAPRAAAAPRRVIQSSPRRVGRNAAIGAGVAAVGAGGYLAYRHHQRKQDTMSKNLVNPFEEVVAFGKAYKVALPVPGAKVIRALVPTGGHVGHGNDLKVVRRAARGGRNATKLEVYRHTPRGQRPGPFGKAFAMPGSLRSVKFGAKAKATVDPNAQVQRSLALASNPKVGNVSRVAPQRFAAPTPRINSNIPDGARAGRKL